MFDKQLIPNDKSITCLKRRAIRKEVSWSVAERRFKGKLGDGEAKPTEAAILSTLIRGITASKSRQRGSNY